MYESVPFLEDFQFVQRCLEGDEGAVRTLLREYRGPTCGGLIARGASPSEADDAVGQLWAEAIHRPGDRPGRLAGYNGECQLSTYLNTVVFNIWFTEYRKRKRHAIIHASEASPGPESGAAGSAPVGDPAEVADPELFALLTAALDQGARRCSPEQFVVVQLSRFDGLLGAELGTMFGRSESWVSRTRAEGEAAWRAGVEAYLQEREPLLKLRWADFVELCSVAAPNCLGLE